MAPEIEKRTGGGDRDWGKREAGVGDDRDREMGRGQKKGCKIFSEVAKVGIVREKMKHFLTPSSFPVHIPSILSPAAH